MGILVPRWTTIKFAPVVSNVPLAEDAYIHFPKGAVDGGTLQNILGQLSSRSLTPNKVTTLQDNFNMLVPGLAAVLLTFLCMWLLKKKVSPILIIFGLFAAGIIGYVLGIFAP